VATKFRGKKCDGVRQETCRTTLQGLPTASTLARRSYTTILPAATTVLSPMLTAGQITRFTEANVVAQRSPALPTQVRFVGCAHPADAGPDVNPRPHLSVVADSSGIAVQEDTTVIDETFAADAIDRCG